MLNLDDLTYKIRLDDSEVERVAARTTQQMQRLGTAVAPARQEFAQLSSGCLGSHIDEERSKVR